MDNTTKNKVIAAFMGVIWYDSYMACREGKLKEIEQGTTPEEMEAIAIGIDERHQWEPEYHNSYDRMIPVVRSLKKRLAKEFGMSMYAIELMHQLDKSLLYEDKLHLFKLLYETILEFNQLTKNITNGESTDTNQTQQVQ